MSWGEVPDLGLPAWSHTLPESGYRREVKVYAVPAAVSVGRYFVSVKEGSAPAEMPSSRVRETDLVVHYTLDAGGEAEVRYVHPALLG
jgi:hypothetical protein